MIPGLSPRVRGNPIYVDHYPAKRRSIPACAGEPGHCVRRLMATPVYPRVCGGIFSFGLRTLWVHGLSPRVRGNRISASGRWQRCGSIPACAGEPRNRHRFQRERKVYPRVCGGTRIGTAIVFYPSGLSPRVRGNQGRARGPDAAPRSNGLSPRVRGNQRLGLSAALFPTMGLSPRVRGNRA